MSDDLKTKDDLVGLLRNGFCEEFNEQRSYDEESLLDLTEADLRGQEVSQVNMSYADLSGSDLSDTELNNVDFSYSDLSSIDFTGSILKNCDLSNATLAGAKFNSANIIDCTFTDADMTGADFSEADLSKTDLSDSVNLSQCNFNSFTVWPDPECLPDDFDSEYIEDLSSLTDDLEVSEEYE